MLTRWPSSTSEKTFATFEEEAALRAMAVSLRAKEKRSGRQLIHEQKKYEEEEDSDSDSDSEGSVGSGVSTKDGYVLEKSVFDRRNMKQ